MSNDSTFQINRIFDASLALMWKAWTDEKMSSQWFGPKGCIVTYQNHNMTPGGDVRYAMDFNGHISWGKAHYLEVLDMKKLVFLISFANEKGDIIMHPAVPNWPKEVRSTIIFTDKGDKTEIALEWQPYHATELEIKTFSDGKEGMKQGWTGTFDQLDVFLKTVAGSYA